MASSEFDTVYREAYLSATGHEFDEAEYHEVLETLEAEILTSLTSTPVATDYSPHEKHIIHPSIDSFDDTDIALIARTRLFGRAVIDQAKDSLRHNPFFAKLLTVKDNTHSEAEFGINLQFRDGMLTWHEGNSELSQQLYDDDTSIDLAHVASPLRLKEWPHSPEYVNCLGVAIGMAAAAELTNTPYHFANELRHANGYLAERHLDFRHQLTRLHADFFDNPDVTQQLTLLETTRINKSDPHTAANLLLKTPYSLTPKDTLRDFHHFITTESVHTVDGKPVARDLQIDPYSLTFGVLRPPIARRHTLRPSEVLVRSTIDGPKAIFKLFDNAIPRAKQLQPRLQRDLAAINYKSPRAQDEVINTVKQTILDICRTIYAQLDPSDQAILEEDARNFLSNASDLIRADILAHYADQPEAAERTQRTIAIAAEATTANTFTEAQEKECKELEAKNKLELFDAMQYDSSVRRAYLESVARLPAYFIVGEYVTLHSINFHTLTSGVENIASEFGEPATMIGAMYLNHYATSRKDGKINVARELARVIPSQLLWYAAAQDTETDERHAALGKTIHSLKPQQLHPLVEIARHIH